MNRTLTLALAVAVLAPSTASASVKPIGLLLGDATAKSVSAVAAMIFVGNPGKPTVTCTRASWMAARCAWSVGVASPVDDTYSNCSGTLSIVRKQVKGYPLTATKVAGTKVKCVVVRVPTSGS